jgi:hypothetical protein
LIRRNIRDTIARVTLANGYSVEVLTHSPRPEGRKQSAVLAIVSSGGWTKQEVPALQDSYFWSFTVALHVPAVESDDDDPETMLHQAVADCIEAIMIDNGRGGHADQTTVSGGTMNVNTGEGATATIEIEVQFRTTRGDPRTPQSR